MSWDLPELSLPITTTAARRAYVLQHEEFHRDLNEKYRRLAGRHPGDVRYQLRLREQKQAKA